MLDIQKLFPSVDGNYRQQEELLFHLQDLISKVDNLKDETKLSLGDMPEYTHDYYNQIMKSASIPQQGISLRDTINKLIDLSNGQRMVNSRYVANAAPLPNTASILGNLLMTLLNGNNVWDVEGSAASHAEVHIVSALSKVVGYDENDSSGYTTWGGQGAVFNSLRLAIAKRFPNSNVEGVPNNLYAFCSELSHYSLFKSVQATGIGTSHLIKVKADKDDSMNIADLKKKIDEVVAKGGIPIYVLATMGTTDSFGIDDIEAIKNTLTDAEATHNLDPIYLHADTAMSGMFTFFNDYDFYHNPLSFNDDLLVVLKEYRAHFSRISLADSMVFDFHKLGQTPYTTSLFLVKDKNDLTYVDLDEEETPYLGNRGYGSYHTSYTLECSRMGSAIPIYASLLSFGIEGYQKLLANYLTVNMEFRKALLEEFPTVSVTNRIAPVTTFRFYEKGNTWNMEALGLAESEWIDKTNEYNAEISERLGMHREELYFGSTSKQCLITAYDTKEELPVYVHKFFSISPYTTVDNIPSYMEFLSKHVNHAYALTTTS